ncbi:helicase HerA-like domain-containing protein [Acinetobacter baumannii]
MVGLCLLTLHLRLSLQKSVSTLISQSIIAGAYEQAVDRDSAYEMLQNKVAEREQQKQDAELAKQQAKEQETLAKQQAKEQERLAREQQKEEERAARERAKLTQDIVGTFAKVLLATGGSTGKN